MQGVDLEQIGWLSCATYTKPETDIPCLQVLCQAVLLFSLLHKLSYKLMYLMLRTRQLAQQTTNQSGRGAADEEEQKAHGPACGRGGLSQG